MTRINKVIMNLSRTYHNSTQWASSTMQAATLSWKTLLPISSQPFLLNRASGWVNTIEVLPLTTSWENFVESGTTCSLGSCWFSNKLSAGSSSIGKLYLVSALLQNAITCLYGNNISEFFDHSTIFSEWVGLWNDMRL